MKKKHDFFYYTIVSAVICVMFVAGLFVLKNLGEYFEFVNFWSGKSQSMNGEDIVVAKNIKKNTKADIKYISFIFEPKDIIDGEVYLKADFNLWDDNLKLEKNSKGIWEISVALLPGEYKYYFEANGERILDSNEKTIEIEDEKFCVKKVV